MTNFCPSRHLFGKRQEDILLEQIQKNIGEILTQTKSKTAIYDYTTDSYNIELKSRTYKSTAFDTWLISCSKFEDVTKKIVIYYYWSRDNTLWRYDFNPEDLGGWKKGPSPISSQLHYSIPRSFFKEV